MAQFPSSSAIDDLLNPYLLHHGDNPGQVLVSQILTGENYISWSRSMRMALSAKNKFGFVDGSILRPDDSSSSLFSVWERNNHIVISWLLNSMAKEIAASVMYLDLAFEIWNDLHERFHQRNGPQIFQLKKELLSLVQGNLPVSQYFTQLKAIWEELANYKPSSSCSCGGMKSWTDHIQMEYVLCFLMGLNESYSPIRGQILLMDPIPSINKVFSLVSQEERQREIGSTINSSSESQLAFAIRPPPSSMNSDTRHKSTHEGKSRSAKKERPMCSHCGMLGHTIDRCYKIHGYPPGQKYNKSGSMPSPAAVHHVHDSMNMHHQPGLMPSPAAVHHVHDSAGSSLGDSSLSLSASQYKQLLSLLTSQISQATQPAPTAHIAAAPTEGFQEFPADWQGEMQVKYSTNRSISMVSQHLGLRGQLHGKCWLILLRLMNWCPICCYKRKKSAEVFALFNFGVGSNKWKNNLIRSRAEHTSYTIETASYTRAKCLTQLRKFKVESEATLPNPFPSEMATSKMRVEELRTELHQRGLTTTGTKPTLVRRLQAALRKETQHLNGDAPDAGSSPRKRTRNSDNDDSLRGIPVSDSNVDDDGEEATEEEEKIVTATKKGAAVLDQWLPDYVKAQYHVLQLGGEIYDAMLNQTNVGDNNNKFYLIQVLESDDGGRFLVYNRWGRVGVKGQDKIHGPYTSRESAIQEFEQKFLAKTRNYWSNRKNFVCYPKSYAWLEMDYSGKEEESTVTESPSHALGKQSLESKLEPRVAKFISLVCNVNMMNQQMMEIGYNANKMPLGKLSKSTILKGYDVLKRLADVIDKSDRKALEQLSGEFYTVIPHDFGFKKMSAFVIDTHHKLKRKLEMVEALGEIEVATKLLKDDAMQGDPLYARYERLHCELVPVEFGCEEHSMVENYMKNTHAETHSNYTVEIVQIFRTSREGEAERFRKFSNPKNRMLLWHGSRLSNWTGILSQGLRIAPPEAPVTGYMFGKGVYFADMFSKSANYCYATCTATDGVLLLCEVALGEMAELLTAKYDADRLPEGKLSTKGLGGTAPDFSKAQELEDGLMVPLGKPIKILNRKGDLLYNEYIVYNVEQIRMRYIVHVNFNFKRRR